MKVAFTGKGGVGKTTLSALFIQSLAKDGKEVLAVDCDPNINLGRALGFKDCGSITPIVEMKDMINKRMGVDDNNRSFFKLNPKIDDIPDKFSKVKGNIRLIVMGTVQEGGSGCMCPENTFVKNLLSNLLLDRGEHVVMDMEAGVEHLGRGTASSCDFALAVVEPSINSIETAKKICRFAHDIGIKKVFAIGNKLRDRQDIVFIKKCLGNIRLIETIEFDRSVLAADKKKDMSAVSSNLLVRLDKVKGFLEDTLRDKGA